ncbi:putative transcription factor WD40-like family [Dioscorea sansibarensis]
MTLMGLMVFQCLVFFLQSDVNPVTFADESGHIIYSGSDDHLYKVAGVLTGHLQGITSIDSHGDGRYFISNGKDQGIKL